MISTRRRSIWTDSRLSRAVSIGWICCLLLIVAGCKITDSSSSEDAGSDSTTSTANVYQGDSVDEANDHLQFDLVMPATVPSQFARGDIIVHGSSSPATAATLEYSVDESDNNVVSIYQTSEDVETPDAESMQAVALADATSTASLPSPSQEEMTIAGQSVLLTTIHSHDGLSIQTYSWDAGNLHLDVSGWIAESLTTEDLEALAESFIQSSAAQTPTQ